MIVNRTRLALRAAPALWAAAALLVPSAAVLAAAPITLQVEVSRGLLGVSRSGLSRLIAMHMADAGLADWRFAPAKGDTRASDRIEWTFRLNPYAGGEVRNFVHTPAAERSFGTYRPITIEARLYLNGEYQTLVEQQAIVQGGPDDPDLAAAVADVTRKLLGPDGALPAIERGQAIR